ncbi:MAG TPA: hypothetical protein VL221_14290 [Bacteroidota bacterium]|nr:hypothetical protein [Bacteroidota bacterium]
MDAARPTPASFQEMLAIERRALEAIRAARRGAKNRGGKGRPFSLALSGGGIRSATFNLGLLEALASSGSLAEVDYISSVSGGGYINSWLAAWCVRRSFRDVLADLASPGGPAQPRAIGHLRKYSNYLTPRLGLLSADAWTLVSTYLRNLILNFVIILLSAASALLVPRVLLLLFSPAEGLPAAVYPVAAFVVALLAVSVIAFNFASIGDVRDRLRSTFLRSQPGVQYFVVLPVAVTSLLISFWFRGGIDAPPLAIAAAGGAVLYALLWLLGGAAYLLFLKPSARSARVSAMRTGEGSFRGAVRYVLVLVVTGAVGGAIAVWSVGLLGLLAAIADAPVYYLIAPVVVIGSLTLTVVVHIGLSGRDWPDTVREWWSRLGAWVTIYAIGWMALWFCVFNLPSLLAGIVSSSWLRAGGIAAWLLSTASGVLLGKGSGEGTLPSWLKGAIVAVAPWLFVAGFAAFVSAGAGRAATAIPAEEAWLLIPACLASLACAYLLARRVDVNEFSMHAMYRNRLVRCYLGASRDDRHPHPFTGLDPDDDMRLRDILGGDGKRVYDGPFPLFNATLNVSESERLDWQQRKARPFCFTPRGFGFADENHPFSAGACDVSLGTVMATSGAALSPNMGFHTSTDVAFLLTLFNVRLGQWFFNPARMREGDRTPNLSLFYLFFELFGLTRDTSRYVYLSDGGHFENLALYELIRRECDVIVVSDASEDGGYLFGDLGNAVERIRVDLGVEITGLDVAGITPAAGTGTSTGHFATGEIHYRTRTGFLVYVKPSLTGDEPRDVASYRGSHPAFPHQSTGDQWFDESQFEAYRALGRHIGEQVRLPAANPRPARS